VTLAVHGPSSAGGADATPLPTSGRRSIRLKPRHAAMLALVIAILGYATSEVFLSPTDTYVYLAAGERLDAGHDLYAISPGDRAIGLNPPYWNVPTLSPPLLGVLWRPLAAIGIPGMFVGWGLAAAAYLAALVIVVRSSPGWGLIATVALAPFIGWQIGLGNVNGFLALGIVGLWLFRDRPWVVGAILALMISVKVTPVVLTVWLLATGRYRALAATAVCMVALLVVSIAGAGFGAHVDYIGVMTHTVSEGASKWSIGGILVGLGLDPGLARLVPWMVLAAGSAAILAFRGRAQVTFAIAIGLLVLASPAFQHYWLALAPMALVVLSRQTPSPAARAA
jgi:alpha-1,2-mannosyltransferase